MLRHFNPVTRTIESVYPPSSPPSLQLCCRKAIMTSITLKKLHEVEQLPLPMALKRFVGAISLNDFTIDALMLPPSSHGVQAYPAQCNITGGTVILRVISPGTDPINPQHPTYMCTIEEDDTVIVVEQETKSLYQLVEECRIEGHQLNETFLWLLLQELVKYIQEMEIPPTATVSSQCIQFLPDNQIFLEIESSSAENTIRESSAVYEAPEVLSRDNPDSRAFTWSTGCIIYEALALTPAFYDPVGNNPFQVYMKIMQGILPLEPLHGSPELRTLMWRCLQHNKANRINLDVLQRIIGEHIQYMDQEMEHVD